MRSIGSQQAPITPRRVDIDFSASPMPGWHSTRLDIENFHTAISFFFPPGERFFIKSVQHYQDRITDPVLLDEVKRFVYQEAMHTKEHDRCNKKLTAAYPSGRRNTRMAKFLLMLARRFTPKATQLAATCAMEHMTAMWADYLLSRREEFIAHTDPAFASLWLWHVAEEIEHKAVCFDVYRHVLGTGPLSYLNRITCMVATTFIFTAASLIATRSIGKDRQRNQPEQRTSCWHTRFIWKMATDKRLLRLYWAYYRPGFHPWEHNNAHLVQEWKRRAPSFGATPKALGHGKTETSEASGYTTGLRNDNR